MPRVDLISPNYLREQEKLHAAPRGYGGGGRKWAYLVAQLAAEAAPIDAILDYGAGQNTLAEALTKRGLRTRSYDPAVPYLSKPPKVTDFVTVTDVLEHIEPDRLAAVLAHLKAVTRKQLFVVIGLLPTDKTLSDGRQAHICLHDRAWWLETMGRYFTLVRTFDDLQPQKQLVALFAARGA